MKNNLPGFNAEFNINSTNSYSSFQAISNEFLPDSQEVVMQMINMRHLGCAVQCNSSSDPFCYYQCELGLGPDTGGGGGGGGGSHQSCRPSCGPCVADNTSSTGKSKFCLNHRCDVKEVECH